jgi:hypothetical protein
MKNNASLTLQPETILRKLPRDGGNQAGRGRGLRTALVGVSKAMILPRKTCRISWRRFLSLPHPECLFASEW